MNHKTILGLGLATLLALGAGCTATTTDSDTTSTDITNVNAPAEETDNSLLVPVDPNSNVNEAVVFDLVAQQFEFTPATITVNQGDTVVLNLTSSDVPHGFSLPQFNVSETITPGKTTTVEFVADTVGTFTFACSIVCGSGHAGMTGTLIVQ